MDIHLFIAYLNWCHVSLLFQVSQEPAAEDHQAGHSPWGRLHQVRTHYTVKTKQKAIKSCKTKGRLKGLFRDFLWEDCCYKSTRCLLGNLKLCLKPLFLIYQHQIFGCHYSYHNVAMWIPLAAICDGCRWTNYESLVLPGRRWMNN